MQRRTRGVIIAILMAVVVSRAFPVATQFEGDSALASPTCLAPAVPCGVGPGVSTIARQSGQPMK
jgi:hypothetical protein